MHLHLPKEGFKSLREFLKELFTITCGILIALGLEGVHQTITKRHLVQEARANILAELRDNLDRLKDVNGKRPEELANLKIVLDLCKRERAHRGSVDLEREPNLNLTSHGTGLSATSWGTAQSMGALSLMTYQEVKRYKSTYQLQELYGTMQQDAVDRFIQLGVIGVLLDKKDKDLRGLTNEDLVRLVHSAGQAHSYIENLSAVAIQLIQAYEEVLPAEAKPHA